jgi:hypothetical protein
MKTSQTPYELLSDDDLDTHIESQGYTLNRVDWCYYSEDPEEAENYLSIEAKQYIETFVSHKRAKRYLAYLKAKKL